MSIGHAMAKGAVWMVLFRVVERSIGLVSTVLLARLLVPADFGLIAMAMSLVAILELMHSFSLDMALIQNQSATEHHYNTAWTLNVLMGLISALALALLAAPAAWFYHEPRLETVIYVLAFGMFVQGMENIGTVAFRKEMRFDQEFKFLVLKKLAPFSVTVTLAFLWQNYWALVFGMLVGWISSVALSYWIHPYRPRFALSAWRDLLHFSGWMMINNLLIAVYLRGVDFIIGRFSGTHALGLYNIAYEIANLPSSQLVAPISRAVFPGYAKLAADLDALKRGFLNVQSMVALAMIPIGAGIALTSEHIVGLFLGPKWADAVPLMTLLAMYGVIQSFSSMAGSIFLALGKTKAMTSLVVTNLCLMIPSVVWAVRQAGAVGAAWAMLGVVILFLPISLFFPFRWLNIRASEFILMIWRPILAAATMYFSVKTLVSMLLAPGQGISSHFHHLAIAVPLGAAIYIGLILVLWRLSACPPGAEDYILGKVRRWRAQRSIQPHE